MDDWLRGTVDTDRGLFPTDYVVIHEEMQKLAQVSIVHAQAGNESKGEQSRRACCDQKGLSSRLWAFAVISLPPPFCTRPAHPASVADGAYTDGRGDHQHVCDDGSAKLHGAPGGDCGRPWLSHPERPHARRPGRRQAALCVRALVKGRGRGKRANQLPRSIVVGSTRAI